MNTEPPRKSLVPKSRVLGVVLVLCLLVLVSTTLIVHSQPSAVHASGGVSGIGCCGTLGIGLSAKLQKRTNVLLPGTWSCGLPRGSKIQFAEITVALSQITGASITRASTAISIKRKCNGLVKIFHALLSPLVGARPFHVGKAHVTSTLSVGYYNSSSSSSYYDLLVRNVVVPDVEITITH